jgi:hypothetical protein
MKINYRKLGVACITSIAIATTGGHKVRIPHGIQDSRTSGATSAIVTKGTDAAALL